MRSDPVLSMLSLSVKAGKVKSGECAVEKAVKAHKASLVIVANDASDGTKKSYTDMCTYYETPLVFYGDKERLGHAIGREFRAAVAVCDAHLAEGLSGKMNEMP